MILLSTEVLLSDFLLAEVPVVSYSSLRGEIGISISRVDGFLDNILLVPVFFLEIEDESLFSSPIFSLDY